MLCRIKCKCTDGEIDFKVRDRGEGEDISDYMQHIQTELGKWHRRRMCSERALEYLKMPITDEKPIGVS